MPVLVLAEEACRALIAERQRSGGDRYDEVWDGVYVINPLASTEHRRIVSALHAILFELVTAAGRGDVFRE